MIKRLRLLLSEWREGGLSERRVRRLLYSPKIDAYNITVGMIQADMIYNVDRTRLLPGAVRPGEIHAGDLVATRFLPGAVQAGQIRPDAPVVAEGTTPDA